MLVQLLMRVSAYEVLKGKATEMLLLRQICLDPRATEICRQRRGSLQAGHSDVSQHQSFQASWRSSANLAMTYSFTHVGIPDQLQCNLACAFWSEYKSMSSVQDNSSNTS